MKIFGGCEVHARMCSFWFGVQALSRIVAFGSGFRFRVCHAVLWVSGSQLPSDIVYCTLQ